LKTVLSVRTILKTTHALCGTDENGLVKRCTADKITCTICHVTGRYYIGETSRPIEVHIKEHKYNLIQGMIEKSKVAQHAYEEG
jgi:hypothetical protein